MFYYKIHRARNEVVLAVCDKDILGKKLSKDNLQIEIKKEFYGGQEADEAVIELFKEANIINLIGKKIVALAIKSKWISKDSVIKIEGIPHAQIIKI